MTFITSSQNPRLKALKRLAARRERDRSRLFAVEGEDLVLAAARAGRPPIEGFRLAGCDIGDAGAAFHDVDSVSLRAVSSLASGTRAIGVYEQRWGEPLGPLCVYLHGVGDPGNVGTILRSAQAFGASCVAFGPRCADPHSPKAVRASMGAIFSVDLARIDDVGELPGQRVALLADGARELRGVTGQQAGAALTLLVGAEREGLPAQIVAACQLSARIPIASESLNAAMAATVALYEVTRGRELASGSSRVRAS